jgi:hypothetical protein
MKCFVRKLTAGLIVLALFPSAALAEVNTYELTLNFPVTKPFNITQTELLCTNLFSRISSSTLFMLNSIQGPPYSCTGTNSDDGTTYSNITMTIYANYLPQSVEQQNKASDKTKFQQLHDDIVQSGSAKVAQ